MDGHIHLGIAHAVSFALILGIVNIVMRIIAGTLTLSNVPLLHRAGEALGFAY